MKRSEFLRAVVVLAAVPFIPKPEPEILPGLNGAPFKLNMSKAEWGDIKWIEYEYNPQTISKTQGHHNGVQFQEWKIPCHDTELINKYKEFNGKERFL